MVFICRQGAHCNCLRVTRMAWLPGGRWAPDSSDSAWNAGYAAERMASAPHLLKMVIAIEHRIARNGATVSPSRVRLTN